MNQNAVIIFSGYNPRGVIAFCRFCSMNNFPFFIVASNEKDTIFLSAFKTHVIDTRKSPQITVDDLFQYRRDILQTHKIDKLVVLPSTEYLNRFLLKNAWLLQTQNIIVPLCRQELYEKISDKYSFGELCKESALIVPAEFTLSEECTYPIVAKPKGYFTQKNAVNEKPAILNSADAFVEWKEKNIAADFYFQEFVGGHSYYLLYYFSKDGRWTVYSQENLIQQSNGLSIIAARSSDIHKNLIALEYAQLLKSLDFFGLIMIEVKYFKEKFYMIEANPRLWGPSQLILDAGMALFHEFAMDNGLVAEPMSMNYETGVKYFWGGGICEDQKLKRETAFHHYNQNAFFAEYGDWVKADIYARHDSYSIYLKEIND